MITLVGKCEKHDLALALGRVVKESTGQNVVIVSDRDDHYRWFEGEVSGIKIANGWEPMEGFVIYDCYDAIVPEGDRGVTVAVTSPSKRDMEFIKDLYGELNSSILLVQSMDCSVKPKYIETFLPYRDVLYYEDSSRRKIDWVMDGKVNMRKIETDFSSSLRRILEEVLGPEVKVKNTLSQLRRRG